MTLRTLLEHAATRHPNRLALRYKQDGEWMSRNYQALALGVRQMAEAFGALGIQPKEERAGLMMENGPEWIEAYLALTGMGIPVVPLDPKLRNEEVLYMLQDSSVVLLITDAAHQAMLTAIVSGLPALRQIILLRKSADAPDAIAGRPCLDYETLRQHVAAGPLGRYDAGSVAPQDVASIIYTSGTTGRPKGAMLTHNNFCSDAQCALVALEHVVTSADDFLVVLPLFHSFSFTANFILSLTCASGLLFVESLRTLSEDMQALRPSLVMAVPLLAEKILDKIEAKIHARPLARFLLRIGLGRQVGKRVLKSLGGRLRFFLVGGAPCPVQVLHGFQRLGIPLLEGYGLTECSPVVAINPIKAPRIGTIGKPVANIKIRIAAPDAQGVGELQVRGPIIMKGYLNDLAATREAFDGDWLRTGDLASIDTDGYLTIRGRKKALIVNREGKNIYPEEVEQVIARHPFINDIVVIGYTTGDDPGERVGAIVSPNLDAIQAAHDGILPTWEETEKEVRAAIAEQSLQLAEYKHVRKLLLQREPLERTSIQKIRRVAYQGRLNETTAHR